MSKKDLELDKNNKELILKKHHNHRLAYSLFIIIILGVLVLLTMTKTRQIIKSSDFVKNVGQYDDMRITTPKDEQAISGTAPIRVDIGDVKVSQVLFKIDDIWYASDDKYPFEWGWDTTKFINGQHKVVAIVRLVDNNHSDSGERLSAEVTVNNQHPASKSPAPPKDDQAPTEPTLAEVKQYFSPRAFGYVLDMEWHSSLDNDTVSSYSIEMNGKHLGTTSDTRFIAKIPMQDGKFTYTVQAVDVSGNKSKPAELNILMKCQLLFCSIE
jgi:hypothetical protein